MCAKRIINLGNVRKVIFRNDYRIRDAVVLLAAARIPIYRIADGKMTQIRE